MEFFEPASIIFIENLSFKTKNLKIEPRLKKKYPPITLTLSNYYVEGNENAGANEFS